MNSQNTIKIIVALVIGLALGYALSAVRPEAKQSAVTSNSMMHQMPDGSMMSNGNNSMQSMMTDMMAGLQGKTGDEFDKEFLSEMIVHHQGAVEMAQSALKNAKHQEIKDLADGIISAQNKEIEMMKGWQMSWYK